MAVNPMLNSGSLSLVQSVRAFDSVASEVAQLNSKVSDTLSAASGAESGHAQGPAPSTQEVAEAMVDLKLYQRQVQASAKVIETADEVIGFLLDVRA